MPRDRHGQWFEHIGDPGWDILPVNGIPDPREGARRAWRARQDAIVRDRMNARAAQAVVQAQVPPVPPPMPAPQPRAGWFDQVDWQQAQPEAPVQLDEGGLREAIDALNARQQPRQGARAARRGGLIDHNVNYLGRYKYLDLTKIGKNYVYDYGAPITPFKVDYDTIEQIEQKLVGSVIVVNSQPVHVQAVCCKDQELALLVQTGEDNPYQLVKYSDVTDLRNAPPGYLSVDGFCYWMYRIPDRQNRQGMDSRNTMLKRCGTERGDSAHWSSLLKGLSDRKAIRFSPDLTALFDAKAIHGLRLTNNVALHATKNKGTSIAVEYIGRPLGLMIGDNRCRVADEHDLQQSWIVKDAFEAGLELVA